MPGKPKDPKIISEENLRELALDLVNSVSTMTVATCGRDTAWAAPVYYVYQNGVFFFFSKPDSRHIQEALAAGSASAVQSGSNSRTVGETRESTEVGKGSNWSTTRPNPPSNSNSAPDNLQDARFSRHCRIVQASATRQHSRSRRVLRWAPRVMTRISVVWRRRSHRRRRSSAMPGAHVCARPPNRRRWPARGHRRGDRGTSRCAFRSPGSARSR